MSVLTTTISAVRIRQPLFAERARLQSQSEALQSGSTQWSEELSVLACTKLDLAWKDATSELSDRDSCDVFNQIVHDTQRWLGYPLTPDMMASSPQYNVHGWRVKNSDLLSLIEAEHAALSELAEGIAFDIAGFHAGSHLDLDAFTDTVNRIFDSHLVAFRLGTNSVLVPMQSRQMHSEVVEPVMALLRGDSRFADAEKAYQDALRELRNHDAGDAITDAGTALSEMFNALGCKGQALGDQLASAKKTGLIRGTDAPLTELVSRWVATQRNNGEAHYAVHQYGISDAWMVVHVVGALMIRLSEFSAKRGG